MAVRRRKALSVGEIAEAAGITARTVHKWLGRSSAENRPSRARRITNRVSDLLIAEIASLRRQRVTGAVIARRLR